jgi:precorrin-6A/cobalt-precorrin-6A reductase
VTRILILGGTGEARQLAATLEREPGIEITSSLAGRVTDPALPAGPTVIGGFGGTAGLARFLDEQRTDALVDATHPFARTISQHAVDAAARAKVPLLRLNRPGWTAVPGDRWQRVATIDEAAAAVRQIDGTVFLTTGRRELAPFRDDDRHYLIRAVDPPDPATLPPNATVLLDRGPYSRVSERDLMTKYEVAVLVSRNSGGTMTYAKVEAARELGLPVVLLDRPAAPTPEPETVGTVDEAIGWCLRASFQRSQPVQ